ncbi:hypothetical protein BU15DRAFT_76986 [Melanogaster broomeanus]|nr:hypothetical protein BU15DRAFT_76986 [Melanogaster broomeanus]
MSPLRADVASFALSPPTPSTTLYPDSSTSVPQHFMGTSGFLFLAIAITTALVAGFFCLGRVTKRRTSNAWTTLSGMLTSLWRRRSTPRSAGTGNGWSVDLEAGSDCEHIDMVYARFFHPTLWDLVDYHPATSCTPAICVESEADEVPKSEPKPFGMSSFLDVDDDDDDDLKRKAAEQVAKPEVKRTPAYDTGTPTYCNFSSKIIGTTVRQGPFLSVSEDLADVDSSQETLPTEHLTLSASHSIPSSRAWRYGLADMAGIAKDLAAAVSEAPNDTAKDFEPSPPAVTVFSLRGTSSKISKFTTPCRPARDRKLEPIEEELGDEQRNTKVGSEATPDCDVGEDGLPNVLGGVAVPSTPEECMALMRKILDDLGNPSLDYSPRAFIDDSDSEDGGYEEGALLLTPTRPLRITKQISLESMSSSASTDGDMSRDGVLPRTPPTPPLSRRLPIPGATNTGSNELQVISFTPSPPSVPSKVYIRGHRYNRSPLCRPKLPLSVVPCL